MSISSITGVNGLNRFSGISRPTHKIILQSIVAIINNIPASERKAMFGSTAKITVNDLIKAMKMDPYSKLSSIIEAINNGSSTRKNTTSGSQNQILVQQRINALNKSKGVASSRSGLDHRMKILPPVNSEKILEELEIVKQKCELQEGKIKFQEGNSKAFKQEAKEKLAQIQIDRSLKQIITLQEIAIEKQKRSIFQGILVYNKQLKVEEKDRTIIMRNGVEYIFALKEDKEEFTKSGKYDVKKEFWKKKYSGITMPDFEYKIGDKIIFPHGKSFEDFIKQMPSRVNKQVSFECFFLENKKQNADKKTYYNKKDMENDIKIMKDCFSIRIV